MQATRRLIVQRGSLACNLGCDSIANLPEGWQDAEKRECATVNDFFAIDEYRQLAIAPLDERGFDAQFLSQKGRRTGGLNAGDSKPTLSDGDLHDCPAPQFPCFKIA